MKTSDEVWVIDMFTPCAVGRTTWTTSVNSNAFSDERWGGYDVSGGGSILCF
jgi:hypothetical protein